MAWLLAKTFAPRRLRLDGNEAATTRSFSLLWALHGELVKRVVLVWKGVLSALREASFALFDFLLTSQKSDSSAKTNSLVSYAR